MNILQSRLKNCIQTIIELEPALQGEYRISFMENIAMLKAILPKIDKMNLQEAEVARLEKEASEVLAETDHASWCGKLLQRALQ